MTGDKHHFGFLVKDHFKRFFIRASRYQHYPPAPMAVGIAFDSRAIPLPEGTFSPTLFFNVILIF
jgi:hypothetical protein